MTACKQYAGPTNDKLADIEDFACALLGVRASEELPADILTSEAAHSIGAELIRIFRGGSSTGASIGS